jgi:MYXO-CTERM domain-containing protein
LLQARPIDGAVLHSSNIPDERIMRTRRLTRLTLALAAVAAMWSPALANVVTIDFEGIPQGTTAECQSANGTAPILGYYNGDAACGSRAGTKDLNVIFSAGALAITTSDNQAGGPGGFKTPPSPVNAAGTVADALLAFTVTLEGGMLLSRVDFWYSAIVGSDPVVTLLFTDGGNKAESFSLPKCTSPEVGSFFCKWDDFNVDLGSGGRQVGGIEFSAALSNSVVFDNLSFTTPAITPVPEPASAALAVLGLAVAVGLRRRRR